MQRKIFRTIALRIFALVVALGAACQSQAQDAKAPYPSMAPLDQYLIVDRNVEISLARSAAPESISRDAEIMVLGRHGYETAVKGKNGFVCIVWRSWAAGIDDPDFWNPKLRSPVCLNPPAALFNAVLKAPGAGETGPVNKVTFIFNFFDVLRRKVSTGKN